MLVPVTTERHPLQPFLPEGARVLMLGSFPPKHERWSMEFFYPNWINDMWRVMGVVFFGDRRHFEVKDAKRFDRERIIDFCTTQGIALFDTASEVRRLKDNASDKFLEVISPTDIEALLAELPHCQAIVTTGQKATETIAERFGCTIPAVGSSTQLIIGTRKLRFWRMPSTSRAYPLALDKKAEVYRTMFEREGYTTK
ncbi:MAG: uracil-DNA glycosylase family protein [Rikenellaceae bacterium]|nr:uracil-DNA glycosylase family protein [Rikenellaceae bacterium]